MMRLMSRATTIGHRGLTICNPMSSRALDAVVEATQLPPGASVVDMGCGKGELLIRLVDRYNCRGIGIDLSPAFLDEARAAARERVPARELEFLELDAAEFDPAAGSFQMACCIGATWVLGGYVASLATMSRWVEGGGLVLAGEGFWKTEPDEDYLRVLGADADELTDHEGNLFAAEQEGLEVVEVFEASDEDWQQYEEAWRSNLERYVADNPEDPDVEALSLRASAARERWARWGAEVMGFALYLFRTPA